MNTAIRERVSRLLALPEFAAPAPDEVHQRLLGIERNIILPVRLAAIAILYHSFQFSPWIRYVAYSLDVGLEAVVSLFWVYVGTVLIGGAMLVAWRSIPTTVARVVTVVMSLADALFFAGLTLITGGYDSILYWVFVVLVIRNTFTQPLSPVQLIVNVFTASCYVLAGISDYVLARSMDETTRLTLGLTPAGNPAEVLLVRTLLLLLVALCGFGVQLLLERQRQASAEAREFAERERQIQSTGRLAAEIAHQLKNPLAIINNTTFSLQRDLETNKGDTGRLVQIIREEIERADRILTQVMGYARLTEGRIDKVDVSATLDAAVQEVFPEGVEFGASIQRQDHPGVPRLIMQREHLREMLVNLLANARDAIPANGMIQLSVRCPQTGTVEVAVADNGPGIPREQLQRVFEAYYTTKAKGTGLGLAIVKNTVELYGGTVQVESELGKGSTFRLFLPATAAKPSRP